jgi:hypothetical protein
MVSYCQLGQAPALTQQLLAGTEARVAAVTKGATTT